MQLLRFLKTTKYLILWGAILSALSLAACQRPLSPQNSCNFLQNPDQQRVSWKRVIPVPLYIHSSVPSVAYSAIEAAVLVYQETFGQQVFEIKEYAASGPLEPKRDGYSTIYWMSSWESDRLKEQGRTTVYWSGNNIYEADIRINDSQESGLNFHLTPSGPITPATVDLKSLLVHELGHALGLDHNSIPGSIMNTHLKEGVRRTTLSQEDISNLLCEYGFGG